MIEDYFKKNPKPVGEVNNSSSEVNIASKNVVQSDDHKKRKKALLLILLIFFLLSGSIFAIFKFNVGGITGAAIFGTTPTVQVIPEDCTDGIDNDNDGLADCDDPQCSFQDVCQAVEEPAQEDLPSQEPTPSETPSVLPDEIPPPISGGGSGDRRVIINQEPQEDIIIAPVQEQVPLPCTPQASVVNSKAEKTTLCDGTTTFSFSSKQKFFYDGSWKELDNNIYASNLIDGYVAQNDLFKTYFYDDPSKSLTLSFETVDDSISMDYTLLNALSSAAVVNGNKIVYPNIFSDVDLQYDVLDNTLKESFVIHSNSIDEVSFQISISQASLDQDGEGNIFVYNSETGEQMWYITKPFLVDADGDVSFDIEYSLNNNIITMGLNTDYMKNAKYPVVLDPSNVVNETEEAVGTVAVYGATNVPSQVNAGFDNVNDFLVKSEVFGIKEEFNFESATLSLPKYEEVTHILYCADFNYDNFSCPSWEIRDDIPFIQNATHVTFNVDHFSGWGAGSSTNYNASSNVITGGGNTLSSSNYITDSIVGIISGDTSSSNYKTDLGFFHAFAYNDFPTMAAPSFNPSAPNTSSTIQCKATPIDAENSTVDVEWFWYNSSDLMLSGNNTGLTNGTNTVITTLGSGNTTTGENWNCTIRVFDGEDYSDYVSTVVSIDNAVPYINTPTFNPTAPNTSSNVQCKVTPGDLETSSLTVEYYWYNGSDLMLSGNTSGLTKDINAVATTLGGGNTSFGDIWNCTTRTYDGTDYGEFSSATLSIANSLPQVTSPTFNPSTAYTTDNVQCKATPSDTETSPLTVEYFWYNSTDLKFTDNTTGLTSGVNAVIDTLSSGNTSKGETWDCKVRANDGTVNSYYTNNTITIQNSLPTLTIPTFNDTNLSEPDDVSASATIQDNDTDTGTVTFRWYVNNNNIYNESFSSVSTGATLTSGFANGNYSCNETVKVDVIANDGEENGAASTSISQTMNCGFKLLNIPSGLDVGRNDTFSNDPRIQVQSDDTWVVLRDTSNRRLGRFRVNFSELSENLDMTGVITSGIDLAAEKAFMHINTTIGDVSNFIDTEKVLYIPYSGTAQNEIYVCPGAASIADVNPLCTGKVQITAGETVQGMSFTTVNEGGQNYYLVTGITGTGGGEGGPPLIEHISLLPSTGSTSTVFTWRANYSDAENDAASVVRVEINGTNYTMIEEDSGDTNVINGKFYAYSSSFGVGYYNYKYHAFDEASVYNGSGSFNGPNVTQGVFVNKGGSVSGANTTEQYDIGSLTESVAATDSADAGVVSELNMSTSASTEKWQAYLGQVSSELRIGSSSSILYNFGAGQDNQIKTVFTTAGSNFNFAKLSVANSSDIDTAFAWSNSDADSGANVFNDDPNVTIAQLTNVPSTNLTAHTAAGALDTSIYQTGVFKDDGSVSAGLFENLAYGVSITTNQKDYRNSTTIDYEMIVPVNSSGLGKTHTYYFYLDIE